MCHRAPLPLRNFSQKHKLEPTELSYLNANVKLNDSTNIIVQIFWKYWSESRKKEKRKSAKFPPQIHRQSLQKYQSKHQDTRYQSEAKFQDNIYIFNKFFVVVHDVCFVIVNFIQKKSYPQIRDEKILSRSFIQKNFIQKVRDLFLIAFVSKVDMTYPTWLYWHL